MALSILPTLLFNFVFAPTTTSCVRTGIGNVWGHPLAQPTGLLAVMTIIFTVGHSFHGAETAGTLIFTFAEPTSPFTVT